MTKTITHHLADRRHPRIACSRVALALGVTLGLVSGSWGARAQSPPAMQLRVDRVVLAEANRETPLSVTVEPADAAPPRSFLRIRGLPPTVVLSDGHALGSGLWAVPLRAVPDLKITVPAGIAERAQVTFSLVSLDGSVLAEVVTQMIFAPAAKRSDQIAAQPPIPEPNERANTARSMSALGGPAVPVVPVPVPVQPPVAVPAPVAAPVLAPAPVPAAVAPPAIASIATRLPALAAPLAPAPVVPVLAPEERLRLQRLIEKGDEQLAEGSVAAARLLYARAADAGYAQGALALAITYDPNELARLRVVGIRPDPEMARTWYRKAQLLGASQATERLRRLDGR